MTNNEDEKIVSAFYNMQATILFQGTLIDEKVAFKNVWEKEDGVLIDVYFYSSKKSKIIDAAYFKVVKDLNTGRSYTNISDFLADFYDEQNRLEQKKQEPLSKPKPEINISYLNDIKDELIILAFLYQQGNTLKDVKRSVIADYIRNHKPQAETLSEQYIGAYIEALSANEESFEAALNNLSRMNVDKATELLREGIKICATDGVISYKEKKQLAEILQTFRNHNVIPDVEF